MSKTVYVHCPFCAGTMEVKSEDGKIVEKWPPGGQDEEGDKMSSALKKLGDAKTRRKDLFSVTKEEIEGKKKKLSGDFAKGVEEVKKKGIGEKPIRPFDLD